MELNVSSVDATTSKPIVRTRKTESVLHWAHEEKEMDPETVVETGMNSKRVWDDFDRFYLNHVA